MGEVPLDDEAIRYATSMPGDAPSIPSGEIARSIEAFAQRSSTRSSQGAFFRTNRLCHSLLRCTLNVRSAAAPHQVTQRAEKRISQHLDDSHDDVCLNFGSNLAAAMFVRNRGCDVVGCRLQFSRFSGLDFVAKQSSLTIGNGRKAR